MSTAAPGDNSSLSIPKRTSRHVKSTRSRAKACVMCSLIRSMAVPTPSSNDLVGEPRNASTRNESLVRDPSLRFKDVLEDPSATVHLPCRLQQCSLHPIATSEPEH